MENRHFLRKSTSRTVLRHGMRTALIFEQELPLGDSPMAQHARAVAQELYGYAEREYLPVAAEQLERLSQLGRGYDFVPHRVRFAASAHAARGKMRLRLSLCYEAQGRVCVEQTTDQIWSPDGVCRFR